MAFTFQCPYCRFEREYTLPRTTIAAKLAGVDDSPRPSSLLNHRRTSTATTRPKATKPTIATATFRELERLIKLKAQQRYGCWPDDMTLLVFDDGNGWTASISKPKSVEEDFYRSRTFGIVMLMLTEYELDLPSISP